MGKDLKGSGLNLYQVIITDFFCRDKTIKTRSLRSWSPGEISNSGPPEYEAGAVITKPLFWRMIANVNS
jgi:hypothetical protein